MKVLDIGKQGLRTIWTNKYLWFFGFFVASMGGASDDGKGSATATPDLPPWAWGAILLAILVLGVGFGVLHILSEGALIEGVADGQQGERRGIGEGLRRSRTHFWRLVGLKLLAATAGFSTVGVVAAPAVIAHFTTMPMWIGGTLTGLLALVGIPLILTIYFGYEFGMRFIVLERRPIGEAVHEARRFLRGRIATSLKLALLALVGQLGGSVAMFVACLPALLIGGLVYLFAGLTPALVVGGSIALIPVLAVHGATGSFRSSVWTLGFIHDFHGAAEPPQSPLPAG